MGNKNYILDKKELVNYIRYKFMENYKHEISPIKLQKSLYFLFAFWGGFISKGLNANNKVEDKITMPKYLFSATFEAWTYGPVDAEIYRSQKYSQKSKPDSAKAKSFRESSDQYVIQFVDNYLDRIFLSSDFGLVDLSHRDTAWKNHYNHDNCVISSDEIINEYASRS